MSNQLPTITQEALVLERLFAANNYRGSTTNPPVAILKGNIPIIIAAPHAVEHPRHNRFKKADVFTGTIALQVARAANCFAVVLAQTVAEDPNYDHTGPFKLALKRIVQANPIEAIINLHGMAESHPWDVVFGSSFGKSLGNKPSILNQSIIALRSAGLDKYLVDSKELFAASNENNISVYSWEQLSTPAFQIEVNRNFRRPQELPQNYIHLINGLISTIKSIDASAIN